MLYEGNINAAPYRMLKVVKAALNIRCARDVQCLCKCVYLCDQENPVICSFTESTVSVTLKTGDPHQILHCLLDKIIVMGHFIPY